MKLSVRILTVAALAFTVAGLRAAVTSPSQPSQQTEYVPQVGRDLPVQRLAVSPTQSSIAEFAKTNCFTENEVREYWDKPMPRALWQRWLACGKSAAKPVPLPAGYVTRIPCYDQRIHDCYDKDGKGTLIYRR